MHEQKQRTEMAKMASRTEYREKRTLLPRALTGCTKEKMEGE